MKLLERNISPTECFNSDKENENHENIENVPYAPIQSNPSQRHHTWWKSVEASHGWRARGVMDLALFNGAEAYLSGKLTGADSSPVSVKEMAISG